MPSFVSSPAICADTYGWLTRNSSAAREKLSWRTTDSKTRTFVNVRNGLSPTIAAPAPSGYRHRSYHLACGVCRQAGGAQSAPNIIPFAPVRYVYDAMPEEAPRNVISTYIWHNHRTGNLSRTARMPFISTVGQSYDWFVGPMPAHFGARCPLSRASVVYPDAGALSSMHEGIALSYL